MAASLEYGVEGWEISAGTAAAGILLEPELVAELSGPDKVRREPLAAGEIPEKLRAAVMAAEDKRFLRHHGLDLRALAGAFWRDLTRGGRQGRREILFR